MIWSKLLQIQSRNKNWFWSGSFFFKKCAGILMFNVRCNEICINVSRKHQILKLNFYLFNFWIFLLKIFSQKLRQSWLKIYSNMYCFIYNRGFAYNVLLLLLFLIEIFNRMVLASNSYFFVYCILHNRSLFKFKR